MNFKIITILFYLLVGALFAKEITGVVVDYNDTTKEAKFKGAKADYTINLDGSSKEAMELRALLSKPSAKNEPVKYDIPTSLISSEERVPFGVRSDCSEIGLSIDRLDDIALESNNLLDFLQKIPDGTLQGFTFITNTRSLQRGEGDHLVDEKNPRILRGSIDGKITISYVCHPKQDKHNTVEVIYFDDKQDKFKTLSYDFNSRNGVGVGAAGKGKRVHHSPQSCVSCHSTTPKNGQSGSEHLKLNWPEYFFWGDCDEKRGITFYGMSDDNMGRTAYRNRFYSFPGCNRNLDRAAHERLKNSFKDIQAKSKTDPCLQTLPWAQLPQGERKGIEQAWTDQDYSHYPYADSAQKRSRDGTGVPGGRDPFNYSLRTNARMTDAYGHLTGVRNYRLLKDNPNYDKFKIVLAMESLRTCLTDADRQRIGALLGLKNIANSASNARDPNSFPLFKSFAKEVVGFEENDFTMHPPEDLSSNPRAGTGVYNTVIFSDTGSDHGIHDITLGHVLDDVASSLGDPQLIKDKDNLLVDGIANHFGSRFSCFDELGRGVSRDVDSGEFQNNSNSACAILKRKLDEELAKLNEEPALASARPTVQPDCSTSKLRIDNLEVNPMTEAEVSQVKSGQQLAQRCNRCHTGDQELGFIPQDPKNANEVEVVRLTQFSSSDDFWGKVTGHLKGDISPRMPFGCNGGDCFNSSQQRDLLAYLSSITDERYFRYVNPVERKDCTVNGPTIEAPSRPDLRGVQ